MSPLLKTAAFAAALAFFAPSVANAGDAHGTVAKAAASSQDHDTLVAALKAAGLVETLDGSGPFTVFAPTDAAFAKLPAGAVDSLLQPANLDQLRAVLTYHVVAGQVSSAELVEMIRANGGQAVIKTVQGATITARLNGGGVEITDSSGGTARVTQADLVQSNGVIHVTDAVFLPR
jgi:uncharacterized surface protein with fasciclin (FAS1) repeats